MISLSFDDCAQSDVRAADLCTKYEVPAIFYWPVEYHSLAYEKGYNPLNFSDAEDIAETFEVGSHTVTHRHLTQLSPDEVEYEVVQSKHILEHMYGLEIKSFCYPRGYTNDWITELVLEHYETDRLTKGPNLVHIHPNSGANGNKPWQDRAKEIDGDIHGWSHSWELDKFDLWKELEDWLHENTLR